MHYAQFSKNATHLCVKLYRGMLIVAISTGIDHPSSLLFRLLFALLNFGIKLYEYSKSMFLKLNLIGIFVNINFIPSVA